MQACQTLVSPRKPTLGNSVSFPQWLVSMCPVFKLPASSDLPIQYYLGSTVNWITEMTWLKDPFCGWEWKAGKKSRFLTFWWYYTLILNPAKPSIFTLMCLSKCFTGEIEPGTLMAALNLEARNAIFPSFFPFSTCCALTRCFGVVITVYWFICNIMKCSELCYWCAQAAPILFLQKVPTPVSVCRGVSAA